MVNVPFLFKIVDMTNRAKTANLQIMIIPPRSKTATVQLLKR